MAPHPDNPRLPVWHKGVTSQTHGSAAPVAGDDDDCYEQQTSLGSVPEEIDPPYRSPSHRSQPSPQLGQAIPNAGFGNYQQDYTNQSTIVYHHTSQGDHAMRDTTTRVTRSRSAKQTALSLFDGDGDMSLNRAYHSKLSYPMPPPAFTSLDGQNVTSKRKADPLESASESVKAPRIGDGPPTRARSPRQTTLAGMFGNTQSAAPNNTSPKREASQVDSTHRNPPKSRATAAKPSKARPRERNPPRGNPAKDKASKNKNPGCNAPGSPDGGGDNNSTETASDMKSRSKDKPLRHLREIVRRMMDDASPSGLRLYTDSGRQYYIRVGTLCSGTDAPVHVMNLFEMLKNSYGKQVFTTINRFGCEIEPYKQSFLMRNSKPELLFKDARDFADGDAKTACLVTGAEADIPPVDFFIAGTSCVDFSALNTAKIKEFAGLSDSLKEWKALKEKHKDNLCSQHLSDKSWRSAIRSMSDKTERKHTSTKTFAAALNYAKWHQPMMLIFENVDSAPWEGIIASGVLQLMGYAATVCRLDTKDYHMPQTRQRKYMIAFSHQAFTLEGARALCKLFVDDTLPSIKHTHANSVTDFILPPNSLELHRARNEMELAAQATRERDSNWTFSKSRHTGFRRKNKLPDCRLWIQWNENAQANAPANMWRGWADRQPNRVLDVMEAIFTFALLGRSKTHEAYDLRWKAQVMDCSQNVDRLTPDIVFGRTGCLTPNAIPVLTLEARPIIGTESLRLQGLPVENFDMSVETQAQLQDLAGNAMTTTVVGAVILAGLSAIARVAEERGLLWLQEMFQLGDFKPKAKILNSFHDDGLQIDHGPQKLLHIMVDACIIRQTQIFPILLIGHGANIIPQSGVQEILALGQRARRRCPCQHILAYSSVELHECAACGASFCKSCKGNPEHVLLKCSESLETLMFLPYAQAEHEFRRRFPPILWMRSNTDTLVQKLDHALRASTYNDFQRRELAMAIIEGLCNTTFQLQFVEITDAVRVEYTADSTFILRAVIEKAELIWYLHLDQFSHAGKKLDRVLTTGQPIARAVLGANEQNQFPDARAWELWISRDLSFPLVFKVQDGHGLQLIDIGDVGDVPDLTQRSIKQLHGSVWTFHPECGFAENALWVNDNPNQKLFLFKDVDPIGPAQKDTFVISTTSRDMGRTPNPETRPVLLRIHQHNRAFHREFKELIAEDWPFLIEPGKVFQIEGVIGGWWEGLERHGIRVEAFPNMEYEDVEALAKGAPTSIRRPGDPSQEADYLLCGKYQSLLTTSLPLLRKEGETIKIQETLKTLDLTHQLDLAELIRLIGPPYSAVEMGLVGTGHRVCVIQTDVKLHSDCAPCAPKIPEVLYVKEKGTGLRASGTIVARHRTADQQKYERNLQTKPPLLHLDHNITAEFNDWRMKKDESSYVDVRFVSHGHALLHQARACLPDHPAQYEDVTETKGNFAMEVGVIENPRIVLPQVVISAPKSVPLEDARSPSGFQRGLELFKEQSDSLQWMLHRESVDESCLEFTEVEVAEVYQEQLHLRVYADAKRPVVRRGRVVADNVGFGKTAVCLGLIDVQHDIDRNYFRNLRQNNKALEHLVHLHATLVIVPNQLTQQWVDEAKRFLNPNQYRIVMIPTFAAFQKHTVADLKEADIIICSNKVFLDNKYHAELSRYCSTNGLDKIRTQQKVYRAWYKQFHKTFEQVRNDVVEIVEQNDKTLARKQRALLRSKLEKIRLEQEKIDGAKELSFAPPNHKSKNSGGKEDTKAAQKSNIDCEPLLIFEMFSYARIIWDEFPYENIPVTEFVALCATMSKWMLSGTPPMNTLGDICRVAYLFNVHVARPLQLIKGRQPQMCENEPLAPHSDLESTSLFQSRHSPRVLVERHEQSLAFVRVFMRRNDRRTEVSKTDKPIVLTMSTISFLSYAELQLELRSRQYNANNVGSESRRRLMSRVAWKGKENGRDRAVEALMIRASASPDDVLRQSNLAGCTDLLAAKALLANTEGEIRRIEDRGCELLAKAIFLAYRLLFITLSNTKDELDGQDERQIDYYMNLEDIVQPVLDVDIKLFQSWEAFESAMRMLIWDEGMREALSKFRNRPLSELRKVFPLVFDAMRFCEPPTQQPAWPREDSIKKDKVLDNFRLKKKYFKIFENWLTKTPLHSRRWFLFDNVADLDAAEEELLRLEWSQKVPWENNHNASAKDQSHMPVPISKLCDPTGKPHPDEFDFQHLKALDKSRRKKMGETQNVSPEVIGVIKKELHDYKDTKVFWEEECNRRGLVAKSTDKKDVLIARVAAHRVGLATDNDYVSPESCGITLSDFPQQGKKRIRGGNMEVIFDGLMQTVDGQSSVYERNIVGHARRNLQQVVADILEKNWVCHNPHCEKKNDPDAHYVSLLCGHVFCGQPEDRRLCGVNLCQRRVKNVCIPLSNITKKERFITASSLSGAITQDPEPYLDSTPTYDESTKGPKARAVINLIRCIKDSEAVVVFVQNAAMEKDIYSELDAAEIKHVTSLMLAHDEAGNLEKFKMGKFKVLVQTINSEQAAGSNLHNANHVIFVSPLVSRKQGEWDDHMKQALGRCVRFRQSKTVYVYHMLMDKTMEVDTLEWRMKQEIIVTDGQAVGRFNECSTRDFLARYEDDESATGLQLGAGESRASSILPRDDIQSLMGDDYLSLASIKALRTIDESIAENGGEQAEEVDGGDVEYLLEPAIEYEDEYLGDRDEDMDGA